MNNNKLILASGSPRRCELLARLGLFFEVVSKNIDESVIAGETPAELVQRLSQAKAQAVSQDHQDATILAADTVVALDGKIMGKPHDHQEAFAFLSQLNNRTHEVFTGVCLINKGQINTQVICTKVSFGNFSDDILKAYIVTGEGDDKAGAYAIQGIGAFLISSISGSPTNVIGLPMQEVTKMLIDAGFYPLNANLIAQITDEE